MKPRKTPFSNLVYSLPGGNEDNDLHCQRVRPGEIRSDWDLTDDERRLIAAGGRIQLAIYNEPIPPVSLAIVAPFCDSCKAEMDLVWITAESLGQPAPPDGAWVYACRACEAQDIDRLSAGPTLVGPRELAAHLGVKLQRVYQLCGKGLPYERTGMQLRFDLAAVDEWLEQNGRDA